tara:strand:- start:30113 stop:32779 length:2667 start_codon:yes stop_codon:yes gene_type:complete
LTEIQRGSRRLAQLAAMIVIFLGVFAFVGWATGSKLLVGVFGDSTTKLNTALLMCGAGISLWLRTSEKTSHVRMAAATGLVVSAIALATLLQDLASVDLGLDALLSPIFGSAGGGRMSASTAVAFGAAGCALAIADFHVRGWRARVQSVTILLALVVSYAALIGYILADDALVGSVGFGSMSLNTTLAVVLLGPGIVASRPYHGVMAVLLQENSAGTSIRRLLPIVAIAPVVLGWVRMEGQRAGYYGVELGIAFMATTTTFLIASIAIWNARIQGMRVDELEAKRQDERLLADLGELMQASESSEELLATGADMMRLRLGLSLCSFGAVESESEPKEESATRELLELRIGLRERDSAAALLVIKPGRDSQVSPRLAKVAEEAGKRLWLGYSILQAHEAKRESERSLAVTLESIVDAVVSLDQSGAITKMNASAERLTDWTRENAIGKPYTEVLRIVLDGAHGSERTLMDPAEFGELLVQTSGTLTQRSGSTLPVSVSMAPMKNADGAIEGAVAVFHDVTHEKRSLERMTLALEASASGMMLIDGDGRIALVNSTIMEIFGYSRAELIGCQVEMLLPERFREAHPPLRNAYNEHPETRRMGVGRELYARHKDGSEFPVEIGLNPVDTAKGTHILCSVADISARKREEESRIAIASIQVANRELEKRVDERTKALQATVREREVLLQEVHHRVKNNLQIISSLMNLQIRQVEKGPALEALQDCRGRIEAIAVVHERLYQSDDYAKVPFSDYAESFVTAIFRATGVGGRIQANMEVERIDLPVDTAITVGLIINELVTNAIKHAFPDGREGVIAVKLAPHGVGQIRLIVRDTGVGLAKVDSDGSEQSMGMMLVETLVEQLEGELTISTDGGTRFSIVFKAVDTLDGLGSNE